MLFDVFGQIVVMFCVHERQVGFSVQSKGTCHNKYITQINFDKFT